MIVHTVYKPQENLDYLDDWLNHHTKIGVEHFYMYDNAEGNGNYGTRATKTPHGYTRDGFKFKYEIKEARDLQKEIFKKYNVTHIIWNPKNENGDILYDWNNSAIDLSKKINKGLCAFIDIDEFIIKKEDFKPSRLRPQYYHSMHYYKSVYEINKRFVNTLFDEIYLTKCIVDMSNFPNITTDRMYYDMHFREFHFEATKNYFNHYNWTKSRFDDRLANMNIKDTIYDKVEFENLFIKEKNITLIK